MPLKRSGLVIRLAVCSAPRLEPPPCSLLQFGHYAVGNPLIKVCLHSPNLRSGCAGNRTRPAPMAREAVKTAANGGRSPGLHQRSAEGRGTTGCARSGCRRLGLDGGWGRRPQNQGKVYGPSGSFSWRRQPPKREGSSPDGGDGSGSAANRARSGLAGRGPRLIGSAKVVVGLSQGNSVSSRNSDQKSDW